MVLTDPKEIEIISNAKQPNVRNERRSRQPFFNILQDFFDGVLLTGQYLDLGPGHYDFGEIVRERGGGCVGLDNDPAVVELGRFKGFESIKGSIESLSSNPMGRRFDGVFNKFALNAFWTWRDETRHRALINAIADLVAADGWSWIGPWNGVPKNPAIDESIQARVLDRQRRFFEDAGCTTHELTATQAKYYGIHGKVANNVVFVKNLIWKPSC